MKMHEAQLGNQVDVQAVPVQDKQYLKNDEQVEKSPTRSAAVTAEFCWCLCNIQIQEKNN